MFVEAQADTALFELVQGAIVMMTNPTEVHEQLKRPDEVLHFEAVEFRIDLTRIYSAVTL